MELKVTLTPASRRTLAKLHTDFKDGFVKGLRKAMLYAESQAKKSFGNEGNLKVKTGHLRRSIKSGVRVIANNAIGFLSADTIYAAIHEFGGDIYPRVAQYLRFQLPGGKWVTTDHVYIPERPYLGPAIEDNINKIEDIIKDTIFDRMK